MSDRMSDPAAVDPLEAVEGARSFLDEQDALVMAGRASAAGVTRETPLIELLPFLGLDPAAPGIPQLEALMSRQIAGMTPTGKMQLMADGPAPGSAAGAAARRAVEPPAAPSGPAPAPAVDSVEKLTAMLGRG